MTDELTLSVQGTAFAGWEDIEVSVRAEGFPNSFTVRATALPGSVPINPGDACTVSLGNDLVVTGYVDRAIESWDPTGHWITITGRGKTQDLVDCSAEWPTAQMLNGNALTIATNLAAPYGITVLMLNGASPGEAVPTWPLNYGETGAEIIQRVARSAGLLAYEDGQGRLVLAAVGTTRAASGLAYGTNLQSGSYERSLDQRFSLYRNTNFSVSPFNSLPGGDFYGEASDPGVTRHRVLDFVAEAVAADITAFATKRAKWECGRRAGRSYVATGIVDSWRDSAGTLWSPNTLIPVSLPGVNSAFVISEVHFRRSNEAGTTAEILAMPPQAFTPEPIVLVPVNTASIQNVPAQAGAGS